MTVRDHNLHLVNTLGRLKERFVPLVPGHVGIYVCGPTVYSDAHLGHAKSYVSFDAIIRYFRHLLDNADEGEDKIERRAKLERVHPLEIAEAYARSYFKDMEGLGVAYADLHPRATQHIPEQIEIIEQLIAKGNAYEAGGNIYFSVGSWKEYGRRGRGYPGHRARRQARSAGLRPLEACRSEPHPMVAKPVGQGLPGLAHRVLGDVDEVPRRGIRHPRWRSREPVPAPRV
jgi:cysteinyl-tRNA synthetase